MLNPHDLAAKMEVLRQVRLRFPDAQWEAQSVPGSAPIIRCTIQGETRWIPLLPGTQAYDSLQGARRAVNVYEMTHLSWEVHPRSDLFRAFGLPPQEGDHLPPANAAPARIRFETHQVIRVPVAVDTRAKAFLDSGNQQTRLFALALSEAFGQLADITRLTIAWQDAGAFDVPTLLVEAEAEDAAQNHHWHIRTDELTLMLPTKEIAFQAHHAAAELVRLYIEKQNS